MARIRTIRPEMWESEKLGRLDLLARLTFVGLISIADDEGRGRADAAYLKGRLHPYALDISAESMAATIIALAEVGLIKLYKVSDCSYYSLPGWLKHQKIDRPSESLLPSPSRKTETFPDGKPFDEDSSSPRRSFAVGMEGRGGEGKGYVARVKRAAPKGAPLKDSFHIFMDWYIAEVEGIRPEKFPDDAAYRAAQTAGYRRYGRAGRDILAFAGGDSKIASSGVSAIGLWLQGLGRTWKLDTAAQWFNEWKQDPAGFETKHGASQKN